MLAIAAPSRPQTRVIVDQIVVSVGPYRFHNSRMFAARASASAVGSASPPQSTRSSAQPCQPWVSSRRQAAGVACMTVTLCRRISRLSACASAATEALASSNCAPLTSGRYNSSAAISNDNVVTASSTSQSRKASLQAIALSKFTTLRCSIITPLGSPVEPEV